MKKESTYAQTDPFFDIFHKVLNKKFWKCTWLQDLVRNIWLELAEYGLYDFAEILRFFDQKHPKYKLSENIHDQPLPVCKFFVKKSSVYTAFSCIQLKKIANQLKIC